MAKSTEPVFLRGDIYYAWVPDPLTGETVPRSTKCRTQGEAVAWRRRYLRQEQDPHGEAARSVTVRDVLDAFLENRAEKRTGKGKPLASATKEFYLSKASMVGAVLGRDTLASKITAIIIDRYIATRRKHEAKPGKLVCDHTISKELSVLRAALTLAKRQGKWKGDLEAIFPSSGDFSAGYDPKKASERALSRADVAALELVMKPEKFAVLAFAIAAAAEMAALERARWVDVSDDRRTVRVRGTKNDHRDADIPIATLEQAWLLDFALRHAPGIGDRLFPSLSNIRRDFAKAAKVAGVHHFSPHNVRHTLAKWLTAGGVQSSTVGRSLRHADGRMVESTYGHLRGADDVRSAIDAQYKPACAASPKSVTPSAVDPSRKPSAADASETERFLSGKPVKSGTDGEGGRGTRHHEAAIFQGDTVPGDGVEPPTRGFSIPCSTN